jgi:hypothetical protein
MIEIKDAPSIAAQGLIAEFEQGIAAAQSEPQLGNLYYRVKDAVHEHRMRQEDADRLWAMMYAKRDELKATAKPDDQGV